MYCLQLPQPSNQGSYNSYKKTNVYAEKRITETAGIKFLGIQIDKPLN